MPWCLVCPLVPGNHRHFAWGMAQLELAALRQLLAGCPRDIADVNLAGNGLSDLSALVDALGVLRQTLHTLDVSSNNLTSLEHISSLTHLSTLNASHNHITSISHDCTSLVELTSLDLSHNELTVGDWINVLGELPRLEKLNLVGNPICHLPAYYPLVTTFIPQLTTLDGQPIRALDSHAASSRAKTALPKSGPSANEARPLHDSAAGLAGQLPGSSQPPNSKPVQSPAGARSATVGSSQQLDLPTCPQSSSPARKPHVQELNGRNSRDLNTIPAESAQGSMNGTPVISTTQFSMTHNVSSSSASKMLGAMPADGRGHVHSEPPVPSQVTPKPYTGACPTDGNTAFTIYSPGRGVQASQPGHASPQLSLVPQQPTYTLHPQHTSPHSTPQFPQSQHTSSPQPSFQPPQMPQRSPSPQPQPHTNQPWPTRATTWPRTSYSGHETSIGMPGLPPPHGRPGPAPRWSDPGYEREVTLPVTQKTSGMEGVGPWASMRAPEGMLTAAMPVSNGNGAGFVYPDAAMHDEHAWTEQGHPVQHDKWDSHHVHGEPSHDHGMSANAALANGHRVKPSASRAHGVLAIHGVVAAASPGHTGMLHSWSAQAQATALHQGHMSDPTSTMYSNGHQPYTEMLDRPGVAHDNAQGQQVQADAVAATEYWGAEAQKLQLQVQELQSQLQLQAGQVLRWQSKADALTQQLQTQDECVQRWQTQVEVAREEACRARQDRDMAVADRAEAQVAASVAQDQMAALRTALEAAVSHRDALVQQLRGFHHRLQSLPEDVILMPVGREGKSADTDASPRTIKTDTGGNPGEACHSITAKSRQQQQADGAVVSAVLQNMPCSQQVPVSQVAASADVSDLSALRVRCAALERVNALMQQQLTRAGVSVSSPSISDQIQSVLVQHELVTAAARSEAKKAQDTLKKQQAVWKSQASEMQEQFGAAQALLQVLEERSSMQKHELVAAQQQATKERERAEKLMQELQRHEGMEKAVKDQLSHFQADYERRVQQLDQASDQLAAMAVRLEFARDRMLFSVKLQHQQKAAVAAGEPARPVGGRQLSSSWSGTEGGNSVTIHALHSEIERLVADRDGLLKQLATALEKQEAHMSSAMAAVQAEEARVRQHMVDLAVAEQVQAMQAKAARVQVAAADDVRAQLETIAQEVSRYLTLMGQVEQRACMAVSSAMVRLQDMQQQVRHLGQVIKTQAHHAQRATSALAAKDTELAVLRVQITEVEEELKASRAGTEKRMEEVERMWSQRLNEQQRLAADADQRAAKATVLSRQMDRQLTRLREQRTREEAAAVSELQRTLDQRDESLRAVRRERNALLAVLRQHGIHQPAEKLLQQLPPSPQRPLTVAAALAAAARDVDKAGRQQGKGSPLSNMVVAAAAAARASRDTGSHGEVRRIGASERQEIVPFGRAQAKGGVVVEEQAIHDADVTVSVDQERNSRGEDGEQTQMRLHGLVTKTLATHSAPAKPSTRAPACTTMPWEARSPARMRYSHVRSESSSSCSSPLCHNLSSTAAAWDQHRNTLSMASSLGLHMANLGQHVAALQESKVSKELFLSEDEHEMAWGK